MSQLVQEKWIVAVLRVTWGNPQVVVAQKSLEELAQFAGETESEILFHAHFDDEISARAYAKSETN